MSGFHNNNSSPVWNMLVVMDNTLVSCKFLCCETGDIINLVYVQSE